MQAWRLRTLALFGVFLLAAAGTEPNGGRMFGLRTPSRCLLRALLNVPCPACGLTRATSSALRLQFRRSVAFHPLGPPVTLIVVAHLAWLLFSIVFDRRLPPRRRRYEMLAFRYTDGIVGAALIIFWVAGFAVRRSGKDVPWPLSLPVPNVGN